MVALQWENTCKGGRSTIWWRFNRKKHVKGGGLLYGGVSIENKHTNGGGLLYSGVSIENKHIKGGGLLYDEVSIEKQRCLTRQ